MSQYQKLTLKYQPGSEFVELHYAHNRRFTTWLQFGLKPAKFRRWNPDSSRWEIHIRKLPLAVNMGLRWFASVDYRSLPENLRKIADHTVETNAASTLSISKSPYETLYLLPSAPTEVVKAAYKALASKFHPDHGGDAESFRRIQEAYEEITK